MSIRACTQNVGRLRDGAMAGGQSTTAHPNQQLDTHRLGVVRPVYTWRPVLGLSVLCPAPAPRRSLKHCSLQMELCALEKGRIVGPVYDNSRRAAIAQHVKGFSLPG